MLIDRFIGIWGSKILSATRDLGNLQLIALQVGEKKKSPLFEIFQIHLPFKNSILFSGHIFIFSQISPSLRSPLLMMRPGLIFSFHIGSP